MRGYVPGYRREFPHTRCYTTLGVSVAASESNQSGGPFGGGDTIFDFGSGEEQDGLGDLSQNETATPSATATTPISTGADGAGGSDSGSSLWIWILIGGAALLAWFFLRKK